MGSGHHAGLGANYNFWGCPRRRNPRIPAAEPKNVEDSGTDLDRRGGRDGPCKARTITDWDARRQADRSILYVYQFLTISVFVRVISGAPSQGAHEQPLREEATHV